MVHQKRIRIKLHLPKGVDDRRQKGRDSSRHTRNGNLIVDRSAPVVAGRLNDGAGTCWIFTGDGLFMQIVSKRNDREEKGQEEDHRPEFTRQ